ncbi:MAG: tRNA ((37)-C2)-methylthiotransferase MiaB, partial [Sphingomonas bacterium]|nr:tRNA ((37)-C2)-methylthiotransferase MiaB [Sphingomonas bacterium]
GETEVDFEQTLALIRAVGHAQAFSFKYSPRPGTPAATMADPVPDDVADDRLQRLQALINDQQHAFNRNSLGRRTEVLIERDGKRPGQRIGKSPWLQSIVVETGAAPGEMLTVDIVAAGPNSLTGAIAQPVAA